jgi:hypothetical protein
MRVADLPQVWPASQRDVKRYAKMRTPIHAIVVCQRGRRTVVEDGEHRLAAARLRGDSEIDVYVGRQVAT